MSGMSLDSASRSPSASFDSFRLVPDVILRVQIFPWCDVVCLCNLSCVSKRFLRLICGVAITDSDFVDSGGVGVADEEFSYSKHICEDELWRPRYEADFLFFMVHECSVLQPQDDGFGDRDVHFGQEPFGGEWRTAYKKRFQGLLRLRKILETWNLSYGKYSRWAYGIRLQEVGHDSFLNEYFWISEITMKHGLLYLTDFI